LHQREASVQPPGDRLDGYVDDAGIFYLGLVNTGTEGRVTNVNQQVNSPMRALIACRKSTKVASAKDGQGASLTTQDQLARDFCERNGWVVVGTAKDTISGSVAPMNRKELGRWIADPELRASYDCIVAYKSDRLGARQLTYLCPIPALFCCAGWQSHGIQPTVTRPGPHGCLWSHAVGNLHEDGR
jgi:hypothetical protein